MKNSFLKIYVSLKKNTIKKKSQNYKIIETIYPIFSIMKIIVNLILFYVCNKKFTQLLILIFKKTLQNKKGTAIDWSNFIFFLLSLLRYPNLQIFILKFGL